MEAAADEVEAAAEEVEAAANEVEAAANKVEVAAEVEGAAEVEKAAGEVTAVVVWETREAQHALWTTCSSPESLLSISLGCGITIRAIID